jgi:hypothetical protein
MLRRAFSAEPDKGQFDLRIFGRCDGEPRPSPNVRIAMSNFDGTDEAGSATLTDSPDQNGSRDRLEILVEPSDGALDEVPAVRGVREVVPFVRINHQPCGHAERS